MREKIEAKVPVPRWASLGSAPSEPGAARMPVHSFTPAFIHTQSLSPCNQSEPKSWAFLVPSPRWLPLRGSLSVRMKDTHRPV